MGRTVQRNIRSRRAFGVYIVKWVGWKRKGGARKNLRGKSNGMGRDPPGLEN